MNDPMGYVVTTIIEHSITYLFQHSDLIEEFRMAQVPGALSNASAAKLRSFFATDQSVAELIQLLFVDPRLPQTRHGTPTYAECATLYYIQQLMTTPPYMTGIIDSFLNPAENRLCRKALLNEVNKYVPVTSMNAEALSRVLNAIFEKATIPTFFAHFGSDAVELFHGLLFQAGRECIKDIVLRICDEITPSPQSLWSGVPYRLLCQIFPTTQLPQLTGLVPSHASKDMDYRFTMMLYTCDFITDLIQEQRPDSLGLYIVETFTTDPKCAQTIVAGVLEDLKNLPTAVACESYGTKILNSLLQMHQCGCIEQNQKGEGATECKGSLNAIWDACVAVIPNIVDHLRLPPFKPFTLKHVQILYLFYPIFRVCCIQVDAHLMHNNIILLLLDLMERFPDANILHSAICRLFITYLEDAPILFGEELRSPRTLSDPLRLASFDSVILQRVIEGSNHTVITCFKDIALSYDEYFVQKPPVPQVAIDLWQSFSSTTLKSIRKDWAFAKPENVRVVRRHSASKAVHVDVDSLLALTAKSSNLVHDDNHHDTHHESEDRSSKAPRNAPLSSIHLSLNELASEHHNRHGPLELALKTPVIDTELETPWAKSHSPRYDNEGSPSKRETPLHALYNNEEHQLLEHFG
ncbi:hypothetical protein THRCLA_07204 [Thraustotheca clavata]|uniref:Uncharacterized protein n=1 Tax=Thraustotheca clavata TaxID=74557 RepID=A0A1V9ZFJ6_9STRA|nr:hypothetical protein THRCLA_07204 [Thraustotheca clavata]